MVSKALEAESSCLPAEGHDQKFLVNCLYHQDWQFTGLLVSFILSTGESQGSAQCRFHQSLVSLTDYADAGDYVLSFTITTLVNQRSHILTRGCLFFSGPLRSHLMIVIVVNEFGGEFDQVSRR